VDVKVDLLQTTGQRFLQSRGMRIRVRGAAVRIRPITFVKIRSAIAVGGATVTTVIMHVQLVEAACAEPDPTFESGLTHCNYCR
jgi:hypothetical protein